VGRNTGTHGDGSSEETKGKWTAVRAAVRAAAFTNAGGSGGGGRYKAGGG
jgi:hypothetical protein